MAKLLYTAHVPAGDNLPAVIALHGWGASAHDLLQFAPLLFDGEAIVLCPQGKVRLSVGRGVDGYGWFPFVPGTAPDVAAFQAAADELRAFLDEVLSRYPIDPRRIVLLGLSQAGLMAFELTREPSSEWGGLRGRVDKELLATAGWPPSDAPRCYVCGPDTFVEAVANILVDMGHDQTNVKTERFGPTGG